METVQTNRGRSNNREKLTLETTGVTSEHVPQATDDTEAIQPIKHKDINEALFDQEDINEVLPENESLPDNEAIPEDKDTGEDIEDKDGIPNKLSHPITLTPSTQIVYGMYWMGKNWKWYYRYRFASVIHHASIQVSLKKGLSQFKEMGEKAVSKELLQLHMKITFRTLTTGDLTDRDKYKPL